MIRTKEQIENKVSKMPMNCRAVYRKAMAGKSRGAAVKAFCQECMGYENYANEIKGCTSPLCPLYEYRPYK